MKCFVIVLLLATSALSQMPVAELPRVNVDTTLSTPSGGTRWVAHTAIEFTNALAKAVPGDTIVLDAGATYVGNFVLAAKPNPGHKWILIQSSGQLPGPGTRVSPADATQMAKVATPNVTQAFLLQDGANFYRLIGLEIYTNSNQGCAGQNCFTWFLMSPKTSHPDPLPDHIFVDRCYMHGSPTEDVRAAFTMNVTYGAVVDSYISDIHQSTMDSQALIAYYTPGPLKIVNNFLSATTENIMIGGAGGQDNPYVPADIEIRGNYLWKDPAWAAPSLTVPPGPVKWSVKNLLEFKAGLRALVEDNTMENNWVSGQQGYAVLFTGRSSASGPKTVVNDITFRNNVILNTTAGFSTLYSDYLCTPPACKNPGETKRLVITNNLVTFRDPDSKKPGGGRNIGILIGHGMTDAIFQHNTFVPYKGTECFMGIMFTLPGNNSCNSAGPYTHNLWFLDNLLCRQPTGDCGKQGKAGLEVYMGDPVPLDPRFRGNVMHVNSGDKVQTFPAGNLATASGFVFDSNFALISPTVPDAAAGQKPGYQGAPPPLASAGSSKPK